MVGGMSGLCGSLASLGAKTSDNQNDNKGSDTLSSMSDIRSEFMKYVKMSPIERIRYDYLKSHGLTEESLAGLPVDVRKAIEDDIKAEIERELHMKMDGTAVSMVAS